MKKNILIAVLTVITLMSLVFAQYQKVLAERARVEAVANAEMAAKSQAESEQLRMELEKQRRMAEELRALALANEMFALEQMRKTKGSK